MQRVLNSEGFRSLISSIVRTGWDIPDIATSWALSPNPFDSAVNVSLQLMRMSALGVDEHRRHLSDGNDGYPAGTFWTLEVGNRELIITVKVRTFDAGLEAAEVVDWIRTGLSADKATAQLNDLSLAFVWASQSINIPLIAEDRVVSQAAADFEFAGIAQQVSEVIPPSVGGVIQTVNGNNIVPGELT